VAATGALSAALICSPAAKTNRYPASQGQLPAFRTRQVFWKGALSFRTMLSGMVTSVTKAASLVQGVGLAVGVTVGVAVAVAVGVAVRVEVSVGVVVGEWVGVVVLVAVGEAAAMVGRPAVSVAVGDFVGEMVAEAAASNSGVPVRDDVGLGVSAAVLSVGRAVGDRVTPADVALKSVGEGLGAGDGRIGCETAVNVAAG
jgi:hypothetical protein